MPDRDSLSDRSSTLDIHVQSLPSGVVTFTSGGKARHFVDVAEVERLRAAIRETLCDDEPCARCRHLREALNETPLAFDEEEPSA